MKLIAHRGLTRGPDARIENSPDQIYAALQLGFDCEVDLWLVDNKLYLGHDQPQYLITESLIANPKVWIHAKNIGALYYLSCHSDIYHFFWHERDAYAYTNRGFLWTYPGQVLTPISVCVMPELHMPILIANKLPCYAICSDLVEEIQSR